MSDPNYTLGNPNFQTNTALLTVSYNGSTYSRQVNLAFDPPTTRNQDGYSASLTQVRAQEVYAGMITKIQIGAIKSDH